MFFFFNDTATTEIYTLSLHDALPISSVSSQAAATKTAAAPAPVHLRKSRRPVGLSSEGPGRFVSDMHPPPFVRSEEHTSELQSRQYLVCRLLLEKKKTQKVTRGTTPS